MVKVKLHSTPEMIRIIVEVFIVYSQVFKFGILREFYWTLLFDDVEYDNFFNPLCCKNKRIYYECILQLIEKSKSVPLLYESDARDTLILYLRNCSYEVEDEVASSIADENISSKKSENENASAILRY